VAEHFLSLADHPAERLSWLLGVIAEIKEAPARYADALRGHFLGMLFLVPSTRSRVSFAVGIAQLGGDRLPLAEGDIQLRRGEFLGDTSRALSGYLHCLAARVSEQADLEELASGGSISVISAGSDLLHPGQALTDFFTLRESAGGSLEGLRLAYVGASNNVCHSLLIGAAKLGVNIAVATPVEHAPQASVVEVARQVAAERGCSIDVGTDPIAAVAEADAVYTAAFPVGISAAERDVLQNFQVDADLMGHAKASARFMHCLPAHRGEEVTGDVIDGPASLVWQQAENLLHVHKVILLYVMDAL
jgi:ornithine carbamoyltransferase